MKIAFLNIYQETAERGAETYVTELSKRLSKKHDVTVIGGNKLPAKRWPILWRAFLDPHGVQVCWWTLKKLPKIWREKYDIVIPLNGGWQVALIRLATWFYRGKMIISGQSGKGWDDRNNLWSFPDTFVAISTSLRNWAKRANPFVKSVYIPNGVDLNKFRPKGKKLSFDLEKPIIICVGALTDEKRIDLTIRAVSGLQRASLLIVGEGPLKDSLNKLGKKLLRERFLIKKYDFKKMPDVYRGADLFTLPSPWYRAFEIVLVEAMATNLPVVANEDPIRREIIGDAGYLVDPTDIEGYTEALGKSINTDWNDKPQNQSKRFDWDKITLSYEKLFKALMK